MSVLTQPALSLTEKQQQFSLSAHGKCQASGSGKISRNVLANPFNIFWPVVDPHGSGNDLKNLLQMFLPALKIMVSDEDREMLRKVRGKKYKEKRRELYQEMKAKNSHPRNMRKCLALGVNEVSCALEKQELLALLIASEADPPMLTRHLGTLAATRGVPFLVLPGLKNFTKSALDFSCLALGLKKNVTDGEQTIFSQLHSQILSAVKAIAEEFASKTVGNHCKSETQLKTIRPFFSATADNCKAESMESHKPSKTLAESLRPCSSSCVPISKTVKEIYLSRSSKGYRVFIPGNGAGSISGQPQYLSLSSYSKGDRKESSQAKPKSLQVPLGFEHVTSGPSFLQRVRLNKGGTLISSDSPTIAASSFSLKNADVLDEHKPTETDKKSSKPKHVARYFETNLASLKVKRVQGNPNKIRKTKRQKTKKKNTKNLKGLKGVV